MCDCGAKDVIKNSQWIRSRGKYVVCSEKCPLKPIGCRAEDLTNKKFGRLLVLGIDEETTRLHKTNKGTKIYWRCLCDCGKYVSSRSDHLKGGTIISCGCYQKEIVAEIGRQSAKINTKIECEDYIEIISSNTDTVFLIDEEDYNKIKNYCWHEKDGYAESCDKDTGYTVRMSRLIMNCTDEDKEVDHINHKRNDNRKNNLRIVSTNQNNWNNEKNHLAGITRNNITNKWEVNIEYQLQRINLGKYNTYEKALEIRERAEMVFFREYAFNASKNIIC